MVGTWFARRTFYPGDFTIEDLTARKVAAGLRTSVVLPARNEADTIEGVVKSVTALRGALIDEVVVIDGGSIDGTRALAEAAGATTYDEREVFPNLGSGLGKGDAMWRGLSVTCGDLIVFIDTDIRNPDPRFVWSMLGPLLLDSEIQLVKGFYDWPIEMAGILHPTGGGRVTNLCARPLLNLFWPELAQLAHPLSGEFAGRRELFESIPFFTGYGVEIGMLIDTFAAAGIDAIAQVDLGERIHKNQPLDALSRMAFAVAQTAMLRLAESHCMTLADGLPEQFVQFIRGPDGRLEVVEYAISVTERPPLRDFNLCG
jgi:glucosyl-3-phosphoglycerate synthase